MEIVTVKASKKTILRLIQEDFKMICQHRQFDALGFAGDFPNISYEIWDLLGIPDKVQNGDLGDRYWDWALASADLKEGKEAYVGWVYEQLSGMLNAQC